MSITKEQWTQMLDDSYVASLIAGNPYTSHARKRESNVALCGKKPGQGKNTFRMRDRTGWRYYTDGRMFTCEACHKAAKEWAAPGSDAHLQRALESGK